VRIAGAPTGPQHPADTLNNATSSPAMAAVSSSLVRLDAHYAMTLTARSAASNTVACVVVRDDCGVASRHPDLSPRINGGTGSCMKYRAMTSHTAVISSALATAPSLRVGRPAPSFSMSRSERLQGLRPRTHMPGESTAERPAVPREGEQGARLWWFRGPWSVVPALHTKGHPSLPQVASETGSAAWIPTKLPYNPRNNPWTPQLKRLAQRRQFLSRLTPALLDSPVAMGQTVMACLLIVVRWERQPSKLRPFCATNLWWSPAFKWRRPHAQPCLPLAILNSK